MTETKKITKKEEVEETSKKGGFLGKLAFAVLFVVLVVGGSFLLWQNYQLKAVASDVGSDTEMTAVEIQDLLAKIGKHILLPSDEEPTIATIVDAEKLSQEQAFYQNVVNGDKVLIYMQAQKAVIYRENGDVLVNVGPVYTNTPATEPTATETGEESNLNGEEIPAETIEQSEEPLSIEVRNGSKTAGVAGKLRDSLEENAAFEVVAIADANSKTFSQTVLVDLSAGNKKAQLEALQTELGVTAVMAIPEGEDDTEAEVLVIIGE